MDLNLKDKVVLVSAASSGLGYATALQLLHEGCCVVACGRSIERLKQAYAMQVNQYSKQLLLVETDLTCDRAITDLIEKTLAHYGRLDILITNMGGVPLTHFASACEGKLWEDAHNTVVMSCINLINQALPALKKGSDPCILIISSLAAKNVMSGFLLSNVYKPALVGLTKALSVEFGKEGIRVNSILPGYTMTDRVKQALEHKADINKTTVEAEIEQMVKKIPAGRIGEAKEFANAATFLVSSAASYINGVALLVDGGFSDSIL